MNALRHMFLLLGAGLLVIAAYGWYGSFSFQRNALSATGTVVAIKERKSRDSVIYRAEVGVDLPYGKSFMFVNRVGRKPGHYQVGEVVQVLYLPGDPLPAVARIDTFARRWGSPMVLAAMGTPLFLVGALYCLAGMRKRRRKTQLQRHGQLLHSDLHEIVRDKAIKKSGIHPWVLRCRWTDGETSKEHFFDSEIIWFDPQRFFDGNSIRVWRSRDNPHKYHVDVSWLPTMRD